MNFVKVIEHNGEIYRIGDEIEVVFDSGVKASGKIKGFDTYGFLESGLEDGIEFGKYFLPFSTFLCIIADIRIQNRKYRQYRRLQCPFLPAVQTVRTCEAADQNSSGTRNRQN